MSNATSNRRATRRESGERRVQHRNASARPAKIGARFRGVKQLPALPELCFLLACAALAGTLACSQPARPAPIDAGAFWPTYMGNMARAPFLDERVSTQPPTVVWSTGVGSAIHGMPVVTDEVIVATTADRQVRTLSRQDGSTFWSEQLEGPPVSPLLVGDVIYAATEDEGRLRAMALEEGSRIWERELPSVKRPLALSGDTLYVGTERAHIYAYIDDDDANEPVWTTQLPRAPSAGPLVVDDWLVLPAHDSLFVLDRFSGMRRAAAPSPEILVGEAASDGERLYLATESGSLLAWSVPDLELRWQSSGFQDFLAGPVIADDIIYAVTRTGELLGFRPADGSATVIGRCGGTVLIPPIVVQNGILIGTLEGHLHLLSRDGQPVWVLDLDGSIEFPPVVHGGRILVPMYGRIDGPLGTSPLRGKLTELR